MKTVKVIKTKQGRVTLQINAFGIPEIKVRHNGETVKVKCQYVNMDNLEQLVGLLLSSEKEDKK